LKNIENCKNKDRENGLKSGTGTIKIDRFTKKSI
jgi:hypothetical protein